MLAIQSSLFPNGESRKDYIAGGCYSNVYSSASRPDFVIKQCREYDGSLAWLMWCERNQGRKGVPVIESLVLINGGGYLCTMKRYEDMNTHRGSPYAIKAKLEEDGQHWRYGRGWPKPFKEELFGPGAGRAWYTYDHPGQLAEYAYINDLQADFEAQTGIEWNDVHHGNYMWCTETNSIVVTDPAAGHCDPIEIKQMLDALQPPFEMTLQ